MAEIGRGSCLCGALQFQMTLPAKWCANCHCRMCQKAHGAGFITWVGCEDQDFRITAGEAALRWHSSSTEARRGFCANCGSSLFFKSSQWPGETHIVLAGFDQDIGQKPEQHVFFASHVPWLSFADGLPRLE